MNSNDEKERQIAINHFNLGYKQALEEVEKIIDELDEFEFLRVEPRGTKPTIYIIKKDLLEELQKLKEKKENV